MTNFKQGIFARAVLMDIPRLKGVDWLEPGTPIYPADLDAWEEKSGARVGSGDVVLIRTGRWARRDKEGPWDVSKLSAGLHASSAKWLKARDAAILGSDAASDVSPSLVEGVNQPIHQLVIIAMGMPIFDNLDLEAVSAEAARQERWEFLLTAAPMAVGGGTGARSIRSRHSDSREHLAAATHTSSHEWADLRLDARECPKAFASRHSPVQFADPVRLYASIGSP